MMQKTNTHPRRDFLKKIPMALVSIGALSIFKFRKSKAYSEIKYKTVSKSEADEIIKKEKFSVSQHLKPAPAPIVQKNIIG